MFVLRKIKDIVKVPPSLLSKKIDDAVRRVINDMLSNKVILNVGLCIRVFDILELGDAHILPGDSHLHIEVVFNMIVFRPYIGEVIVGKVKCADKNGMHITLDFFDDIFIPAQYLPEPSAYDEETSTWKWLYKDDNEQEHEMFMSNGEPVRFVVISETFRDCTPSGDNKEASQEPCYSLTGKMNEQGLGHTEWWP